MLCFRDMTFCPFYRDCMKADECHRPLTEEVRREAQQAGLPVSQFGHRPDCYAEKEGG